ncbi:hypothetical protein V5734_12080 [Defluviimonas sp. SAOS-178_SWC]
MKTRLPGTVERVLATKIELVTTIRLRRIFSACAMNPEVDPVAIARESPSAICDATKVAMAVFSARINGIRAWNCASTGLSTLMIAP